MDKVSALTLNGLTHSEKSHLYHNCQKIKHAFSIEFSVKIGIKFPLLNHSFPINRVCTKYVFWLQTKHLPIRYIQTTQKIRSVLKRCRGKWSSDAKHQETFHFPTPNSLQSIEYCDSSKRALVVIRIIKYSLLLLRRQ